MTDLLAIQLLGRFQLLLEDTPLVITSVRIQTLLAFLLLHQENPQPRGQIAFQFWPESTDQQARANLRKLLHQLKRVLPEPGHFLRVKTNTLQWRREAPFTLDVDQFEAAVLQAKIAAPPQQREFIERAVALYSGDLMPSCYDDWIWPKREQFRQIYKDALYDLVQLLEADREFRLAIRYSSRLCQLDPLSEETHQQLMRLQSLAGDRAAAAETFQSLERRLHEELAVEPAAATRDLYARILGTQKPDRASYNLPQHLTSFVGRDEELAIIAKRYLDENCRLLTLIGPGGIGKTRLAVQAASGLADAFEEGIYYAPLEPVSSTATLVTALADSLDFSFYKADDLKQQLFDYLREKHLLLLLDNFEHLLDAAGLLAELLEQAGGVRLLVTSRERLKLPQEWLLEVAGLPFPANDHDEGLERYGAVELFLQRAWQVRPKLVWDGPERRAAVRICRVLDGMPLGIELAAAWLRVLSFQELEGELNRNLDISAEKGGDVEPRHRSLRAVFEQSWQFLSETEKDLWRKIAVFHSRFDRRAAAAVVGAVPSSLMALVDKSLLRLDGSGLFSTHGLVRQYGLEKLSKRPEELAVVRADHCDYYTRFVGERDQALIGRNQKEALAEIATVIDDVRAAWEWAVVENRFEQMMAVTNALARFYQVRGWFEEGLHQFELAASHMRQYRSQKEHTPEIARLLPLLLNQVGLFQLRLSQFEEAAESLEESRAISAQTNGRRELVPAMVRLAEVRYREGKYDQARELCREGLSIELPAEDLDNSARAFSILGQTAHVQGQFEEAYRLFEQSRELTETLGDRWSLAHLQNNLGIISFDLGHRETAWEHFHHSLDIFRDMGDRWGQALVTNNMGQAALLSEQFDEAGELLQESLELRREFGNRWAVAFVLNNLGRLNLHQGNYEQARVYAEESLDIRWAFEDRQGIGSCLLVLGDIALAMGDAEAAEHRFQECLETAVALQNDSLTVSALLGLAKTMTPTNPKRALEIAALVAHHPATTNDKRQEAEQLTDELAAHFAASEVEKVQKQGREMSILAVTAALLP